LVDDIEGALRLYEAGVGLRSEVSGTPPEALVRALPVLAGRRSVRLGSPGDDRPGALRVIELPGTRAPRTLATIGWAAAELIVEDADAATERARSAGLTVLAEPAPVGSGGGLRAAQIRGPAGEALYLTQVTSAPPGFDLPVPVAPVGRIFIAVLASRDLPDSRSAIERLGGRRVTDHPLPVRALNASLGLPTGTRHRVSSVQLDGQSAIEVDQYPAAATTREVGGSVLTGGIVCVSIRAAWIRGVDSRVLTELPGADGALLELIEPTPATGEQS